MALNIETNEISMTGIGQTLKEAREKKNLTIEQAQKQTRIHSSVLLALEEGRCDEILTPMYVKSFLKKYSHYLGLDPKDAQKVFSTAHPEIGSQSINIHGAQEKAPIDPEGVFRLIKTLAIFAVVLFLFGFVWNKAAHYLKTVRQTNALYGKDRRERQSRTDVSSKGRSNVTPAKTSARNRPVPKIKPASEAAHQVSIPKNAPLKLTLIVKQPVLLGLKADSRLIFKRVIPKGTAESFTADESFSIYVAKGEAIELSLNGQFMGSPGKGVIENLEITRKGIRIK